MSHTPAASRLVPLTLLGLCLALSATILALAPRPRGLPRPCEPSRPLRLGGPRSLPLALAHHRGSLFALVGTESPHGVSINVFRVRSNELRSVATRDAPSWASVTDLVSTTEGPVFAVARGPVITATLVSSNPPRDTVFPRSEQPEGRPETSPAIALAPEAPGSLAVLASWPGPFAPRRLHARDVRESPAYTPARRDSFGAQDLVILGDRAVMVQEHREGTFTAPAQDHSSIELVSVPASPFHLDQPRTLRLSEAASGRDPRVAPIDPTDPSRGAFVAYTTGSDTHLLRVVADSTPAGWHVTHRPRVAESVPDGVVASDISSIIGGCDTVVAWRTRSALIVRAIESLTGRVGPINRVTEPEGSPSPRVHLERLGALTLLATHGVHGVGVYLVHQGTSCELTLRPLALPHTQPFGPGARVAGFAADSARVVLAVTHHPSDALRTALTFATISPVGAITLVPPPETIASSVTTIGLLAAPVAIVAGRGPRGIILQRVGDSADDGEPGEDLLLRGSRGEEFTLASSTALHRVWVADTSGPEPSDFGPAGSVVLYSAIDTLEDGPRTEIRMGSVPHAAFARMTLDQVTLSARGERPSAWASAWSASGGPDCIPGAFVALYQPDDRPLARAHPSLGEPFTHVVSLVPRASAQCGDRVGSIVWSGARFAATLSGARFAPSVAFGDIASGAPRLVPIASARANEARAAAASLLGRGVVVAWLYGENRLRYEFYSLDGQTLAPPETLFMGTNRGSTTERVVLSAEGSELAVAITSARGPLLVRAQCRLP